jgi:transcriptional regulator with XRE-family HTH domain
MGKLGNALKQVLETHGISQNQLAVSMGIDRSNISRWVSGERDPLANVAPQIRRALENMNSAAAEEFVRLYLYDSNQDTLPIEFSLSQDETSME